MSRRRRRGRAGKITASAVAVLAAAATAAAAYGLDLTGTGQSAEADTGNLPEETAEITRRTLVDTVTASGDLDYGEATDLASLLQGIVTALPETGDRIERGGELFAVDDEPVVLLYGSLPAYRTLRPGIEGADVEQFEANLAALGYDGFTADDEYTWKTAEAVEEWQSDLGIDETGTVDLGRVVYAPGEVRVDEVASAVGDAVGGEAVLSYSGLDKVVTVELDIDDQELAVVGDAVEITLPDGTTAAGTITDAETAVDEGEGGDDESETVVEVTVAADDPAVFEGLDRAAVDVAFDGTTVEDVLAVPVAALLGLAEGGYGVEIVEGDSTRIVAVETGLFANGLVEVSGEGLAEGMTVGMPS